MKSEKHSVLRSGVIIAALVMLGGCGTDAGPQLPAINGVYDYLAHFEGEEPHRLLGVVQISHSEGSETFTGTYEFFLLWAGDEEGTHRGHFTGSLAETLVNLGGEVRFSFDDGNPNSSLHNLGQLNGSEIAGTWSDSGGDSGTFTATRR